MKIEQIEIEIPRPVLKERGISIQLTEQEAKHLSAITQYIGGNSNGPRGIYDQIRRGLRDLGYEYTYRDRPGSFNLDNCVLIQKETK